ncbi:hypothetical protein ACFYRY_00615 [Streptomyces sp. NPDC005263]|uniref:hypothetical protein n=1 Tax=Streptomyces sp. NPDC005263 TaxID=3364711 RepID=UPI0036B69E76
MSGTPAPRGYGDRFVEDAFDYPSSQATHTWSADAASATATGETATRHRCRRRGEPAQETGHGARVAGDRWPAGTGPS